MATHKTELFGHLVYSPELSYEELLSREEGVTTLLQSVLTEHGADFLHFEALGDTLRIQCMFQDGDEGFYQGICAAVAPAMKNGISARFLLVDKDLETLHCYGLSNGAWQEAVMQLPGPGDLDRAALPVSVADVAPARKATPKPAGKGKK
jgi:hypothetical protein